MHWDLWHLIDACCHGKNQRYQILSSLRDNIEHDNNNKYHKFPGKTFLQDFDRQFLKINFNEKKLYCIQPLRNTAKLDQFYAFYEVLTKEMAQKWNLRQELPNQSQKFGNLVMINNDNDGRFEPLTNYVRSLTWDHRLKALNSSSLVSAANWLKFGLIKTFNTCDDQQFYITKMIMLISSIIVMCSYLYLVGLVS